VLGLADRLIESPLESLTHLALHDSGLPMPSPQQWLTGADGKRYRVDFLWPEFRLIVEADGRGKNSEGERWREKKRDIALERAGYRVVRVTWEDVVHNWPAVARWLRELMSVDQSG
jgi:very-short-patch-repair endonuclease